MDDASTLFYDFDVFGSVIDARPFIDQIAHANRVDREIATGPNPQILYYTGKREIFAADTTLGRISASHNPTHNLGGPDGVRVDDTISVNINFREAIAFEDVILRTYTLVRYLGMLAGRPQNLLKMSVRVQSNIEIPTILQVFWSMPPKRELPDTGNRPHPTEVLLRCRETTGRVFAGSDELDGSATILERRSLKILQFLRRTN